VRGLSAIVVGAQWLRAETGVGTALGGGGSADVFLVSDDGRSASLASVPLAAGVEPGIPVLAPGRRGEVGLAVPVLANGQPRLVFTVITWDAGVPGSRVDGGGVIDAGLLDAGMDVDAGAGGDAGARIDAGTSDPNVGDDAGVAAPDAGAADLPVIFTPIGCGCTQTEGLVAAFGWLLVVWRSRRRR
jgi:uncharacterized protein (TIGR03382 family)